MVLPIFEEGKLVQNKKSRCIIGLKTRLVGGSQAEYILGAVVNSPPTCFCQLEGGGCGKGMDNFVPSRVRDSGMKLGKALFP